MFQKILQHFSELLDCNCKRLSFGHQIKILYPGHLIQIRNCTSGKWKNRRSFMFLRTSHNSRWRCGSRGGTMLDERPFVMVIFSKNCEPSKSKFPHREHPCKTKVHENKIWLAAVAGMLFFLHIAYRSFPAGITLAIDMLQITSKQFRPLLRHESLCAMTYYFFAQ